jgi:hypothetical protein
VLLNAADIQLAAHRTDGVEQLLSEARSLLEQRYPLDNKPQERWRYAAWDAVNASLLAQEHRPDEARAAFAGARNTLVDRWGPQGFYVQRLDQREELLHLAAAGTSTTR